MRRARQTNTRPTSDPEAGGREASDLERTPQRTCLGCRRPRSKALLVRLVCDPTGHVVVDPQGKLPGRGVYLCPQRGCVVQALTGTRLREAFRREVAPGEVEALVQAMLHALDARVLASIRIARKAGRVVSGYTQVARALEREPIALLVVAEDTAPERVGEYRIRCARRGIPYRVFLTKARLGELVGREQSGAIGIQEPRLAQRLIWYLDGVSRLRAREGGSQHGGQDL